jgi:hypothetical protein
MVMPALVPKADVCGAQAHVSGHQRPGDPSSGDQRLERRMLLHKAEVLHPSIEAKNMASTRDDQRREYAGINQMKINHEVVCIFDERPIHVCEPVDDHEKYAKGGADAHHQTRKQRKTDQQMPVLDEEGSDRAIVGVVKMPKNSWSVLVWFRKPTTVQPGTKTWWDAAYSNVHAMTKRKCLLWAISRHRSRKCRIPRMLDLCHSALWLICRRPPCVLRDILVAHADRSTTSQSTELRSDDWDISVEGEG